MLRQPRHQLSDWSQASQSVSVRDRVTMADRKIEIVPANGGKGGRGSVYYDQELDVWSRLKGDEFSDLDSTKTWRLVSVGLAEMLGTAILVGLGCSGLMTGLTGTEASHLNIVLTFACAISLVVTVFGPLSGCHVNPAISLSALIMGQMSLPMFLLYVVCQCFGAVLGITAVKLVSPDRCTSSSFCVTLPNPEVGPLAAMVTEAFMTGILVLVVIAAAWDRRSLDKHDSLPLKFALAIIALALPGGKYSGASLNPARSFGPALLAGDWTHHWVYWVGPLGGSVVASAIYRTFFSEVTPSPSDHSPRPVPTVEPQDDEHPL